jgi:hypothetical protein
MIKLTQEREIAPLFGASRRIGDEDTGSQPAFPDGRFGCKLRF